MKARTENTMQSKLLILAWVAGLALAPGLSAQLSGGYSIDSSLPTAGTNFASFLDAATALATSGVSGPVSFTVVVGVTPYAGFSIVNPIAGASLANNILFIAPVRAVVSGPASGYTQTIHLGSNTVGTITGPSFLTFENLEITGAPAGAAVMISGGSDITFRNCRAHTSGTGIYLMQSNNCVVEDCEVDNVGVTTGTPGSTAYVGGITSYYNNNGCTIRRNRIHDCTTSGIFLGTSGSTTMPLNNIIVNNFIWAVSGAGTYPGGIAIRRSLGSVIANNSVFMPSTAVQPGIHLMVAGAGMSPTSIVNNIVKHDGTAACFRFESATVVPPAVFDNNLYDPGATAVLGAIAAVNVTSLAAWQANAAPNLVGLELASVVGPAGFLAPTDLHITPSSLAFNTGQSVTQVTDDIDLQSRPIGGTFDIGADESPATGLFAGFSASPTQGPATLIVNFQDQSYSSALGGVTSWMWDFQNDGIVDSTAQNPSFGYSCPGTYSVRLTVADGMNPNSTLVRSNLISVSGGMFQASSSGGGIGDLSIQPVPATCYPTAFSGWTLASLSGGSQPAGSGPLLGLYPDQVTIDFILHPIGVGNPIHFLVAPNVYPNAGVLVLPAGTVPGLSGVNLDLVQIMFDIGFNLVYLSNVARVTL